MRKHGKASLGGVLGLLLTPVVALLPWPVAAQSQLEEVIVTARKQEESLQKVPASVTAVGAELIEALQINSIEDVARFTPGFSFSKAFGRSTERPVIRGLSNVLASFQFGVESGAAYFVDGVYYPGDIQSLDIYDVERVEVVRGPQSALYGRNSYSGAINFITKRAQPEAIGGNVRVSVGQEGRRDISLQVSGPLGDTLSGGFKLRDHSYDGEWENLVTGDTVGGEETTAFSGNLHWQMADRTSVRVRYQNNDDKDGTRPFFLQPRSENNCYPAWDASANGGNGGDSSTDFVYFCGEIKERPIALNDGPAADLDDLKTLITDLGYELDPPDNHATATRSANQGVAFSGVERELQLFSLLVEHELWNGQRLFFATAMREDDRPTGSDSDHSPVNRFFGPADGNESSIAISDTRVQEDMSLEFRWESPQDQALRWRVGAFYYEQDEESEDINFPSNPRNGGKTAENSTENSSIFASVSYDFAEDWSVDFELRRQDEEKESISFRNPPVLTLPAETYRDDGEWNNTTPRITLSWAMDEDTTLYGIYAEGVKPGGLNGIAGQVHDMPTYKQEESISWEGGIKRLWMNGTLLTNLAMYFNEITDLQGTEPVPQVGTSSSIAANKGEGEVFGLEAELRWLIADGMDVSVNYALADSEFTKGCDDTQWRITSGGGTLGPDGTSNPISNPNGRGDCSIKGNQFAFSPKHTTSVVWSYRQPLETEMLSFLGDGAMELLASVDWSYESKKYAQVHNGAYVGAYNLLGARIGLRDAAGDWSVTLYGKNLTDADEPVLVTRWVSPVFNTSRRWFFANPRQGRHYGVEFAYKF